MNEKFTTVIQPKNGWFDLHLKELLNYKDIIILFVKRNFTQIMKKEFIVMTNEDESEFAFGTQRVEKVEYGSFKDGKWVAEDCDATIRGNRVVIDGYKVTKVTVK